MAKTGGKIIKKIEKMVGRAFDKTLGKRLVDVPLEGQVKLIKRWLGFPGVTVHRVRRDLLIGIPNDIRELVDKGKNQEEIKEYYWGCEPFRDLWCKTLQMEEATFDELLRGTLVEYAIKP